MVEIRGGGGQSWSVLTQWTSEVNDRSSTTRSHNSCNYTGGYNAKQNPEPYCTSPDVVTQPKLTQTLHNRLKYKSHCHEERRHKNPIRKQIFHISETREYEGLALNTLLIRNQCGILLFCCFVVVVVVPVVVVVVFCLPLGGMLVHRKVTAQHYDHWYPCHSYTWVKRANVE